MSDLRARLADALQEHIPAVVTLPGYLDVAGMGVHGCDCGDKSAGVDWVYHLADVLLSLDGIAIVDTENVDRSAQALAEAIWEGSDAWDLLSEGELVNYRRWTKAALLAAANKAEAVGNG